MSVCGYMHVCPGSHRGQRWVPGIRLRSFASTVCCQAVVVLTFNLSTRKPEFEASLV